jgi:hypothetical protein
MPFVNSAVHSHNNNTGAREVWMPASITAGNTLVSFALFHVDITITPPTGWVEFETYLFGSNNTRVRMFRKVAEGTENGTAQLFTYSASTQATWITFQISGAHDSHPVLAWANHAAGASPNPPLGTASWGAAQGNLFFAGMFSADSSSTAQLASYPDTYAEAGAHGWNGTSGKVYWGWKESGASSDDPDIFGLTSSTGQITGSATMVVRPAEGGGGGTKSLQFTVRDEIGNILADATGLRLAVFESTIGIGMGNPFLLTNSATTNASGICTLNVSTSAQSAGGTCTVVIRRDFSPTNRYGVIENVPIVLL